MRFASDWGITPRRVARSSIVRRHRFAVQQPALFRRLGRKRRVSPPEIEICDLAARSSNCFARSIHRAIQFYVNIDTHTHMTRRRGRWSFVDRIVQIESWPVRREGKHKIRSIPSRAAAFSAPLQSRHRQSSRASNYVRKITSWWTRGRTGEHHARAAIYRKADTTGRLTGGD